MKPHRHGGVAVALIVTIVAALSACGEAPQSGAKVSKAGDQTPWDSVPTGYGAAGLQRGDKSAWEQQMHTRAQNQNEYTRTP